MARARGPARRQLVARARKRRRPDDESARRIDPVLVRRLVRAAIIATSTLVAALVVGPWCRRVAHTHPYFAVREVAVRHRGRLDADAIRRLAGVEIGTNVWDVDPTDAETRLLTNGWIRSADVRRELPDRIVVHVREHRPAAILAVDDESPGLYYVAANGRIFAPVASEDGRDLPFVTGLRRTDLAGSAAFGPRAVRRALGLLRHAERRPRIGAVSELHVDRDAGLTLLPMRPALPIEIGWGQYDAKLDRLTEVLPYWTGRETELRSVSCVFDDEVIVRTRTTHTAAPPRRTTSGSRA